MKETFLSIFLILFMLYACKPKRQEIKNPPDSNIHESSLIELKDKNSTPTVDLAQYKLIVDSQRDRKSDAEQILKVKRKWPLAMQSRSSAEFDSILGKNFTFKGTDSFFNRTDYIKDRTRPDKWVITHVRYDNVTLQFINDTGVLTYKNHITNKNIETGTIEYEDITWVDLYVLEEGKWKIGAAHSIDYHLESPEK